MSRLKNSLWTFALMMICSGLKTEVGAAEPSELNQLKSQYIKKYAWPKRNRQYNDPLFIRPAEPTKEKSEGPNSNSNSTQPPPGEVPTDSSSPQVTPPPAILAPPKGGS